MPAQVCVVGSFMMDLTVRAPRRPAPGETLVGSDFQVTPGGKGFNQAIAAARACAGTAFVGRLGEDEFARAFRTMLRDNGVDDAYVVADREAGTGIGLPLVEPDGQNSIIIVPRANLALTPADVEAARGVIAAADVLLLQLEVPQDAAIAAAHIAARNTTTVVLNPAPYAPLERALLELADIVVPNETELLALCAAKGWGPAPMADLAQQVAQHYEVDVIVTAGSRGAVVARRGRPVHVIEPVRVAAVDTVGAGDVFCGNLGAALARGLELADAARFANAAAALSVTRRGGAAAAPTLAETEPLWCGVLQS